MTATIQLINAFFSRLSPVAETGMHASTVLVVAK